MPISISDGIKSITAGITAIGFVIGTFLVVDDRYAHAQEVKRVQLDQTQQIKQLRVDNTKKFYRTKVDDIEQKKFDIQVRPKQQPTDAAYMQRYDAQIKALKEEEATEIQNINKQ
jgi:alpha/beta superfamily hydrolase